MNPSGLTSAEAKELKSNGLNNKEQLKVSRTYSEIIIKNVITPFNIMLFILGAILLIIEEPINAISAVLFISMNIIIASAQEIKAKRRLDKIAILLRPKATAVRDGIEVEIDRTDIVMGDTLVIKSGDQAPVDGEVLHDEYLEMDESILTGESRAVKKRVGDMIFSGSFCVTGKGYYKVTAFGEDSVANKMAATARKYKNKYTPLQMETTTVIKILILTSLICLALMFVINFIKYNGNVNISLAANGAVIVFDIVPMALPLFVTISYMVAAIRMANKGALLQRANSVESMSHINTICMDKTGTITTNNLQYGESKTFTDDAEELISLYLGATGGNNKTTDALSARFGAKENTPVDEIRFSSDRKFSAVKINMNGTVRTIFLGAPNVLGKYFDMDITEIEKDYSDKGLRILVFGSAGDTELRNESGYVIPQLKLFAVVGLKDELRSNCREVMDVFVKNDIDMKVISGDDPNTINALFASADIPGKRVTITGEQLDALEGDARDEAILNTNIFGRMRPEQKHDVISTLKAKGRYVAMVGDGVNDVSALKNANLGIALHSGAGAAKSSADIVLVNDDFGVLPSVLVEGKRTLTGMKDALKIFLTKNVTIAFLVIFIMILLSSLLAHGTTPMLPTQQTVYAFLAVTVASFFVIVWAEPVEGDRSVMPSVMRYVVPTALITAFLALLLYSVFFTFTMHGVFDVSWLENSDFLYKYGWPNFKSYDEMLSFYGGSVPKERYAEIYARCALVMFVIIEGIIQVLLIMPHWKFLSTDGNVRKDVRPTILVFIMLGLTAIIYLLSVSGVVTALFPMIAFNLEQWLMIALALLIWFVLNRYVIRYNKLGFITKKMSKKYYETLEKTSDRNRDDD